MTFHLGCAIWAYKDWVGDLFPAGSRATDFLNLYSRRFTTVEGNTTFYSIPDAAMVKRWATETPDGFKFCLKMPRELTHQGELANKVPAASDFLQRMEGLGNRLGPYFAQLPPAYSPTQFSDLATFLEAFPRLGTRLALEVRHPDWFREPHATMLNKLLGELGMGRVLLDTRPIYDCPDNPQLDSERRKPRVPLHPTLTTDFSLIRYISHPQLELNQLFLEEWVVQVGAWLQQRKQIYFFVHCPVEVHSPTNAKHFQQLLESGGVDVPPLPWNRLTPPPDQLSLF
ncbi:MAG: DUF72 domain-containing protein [Leptolyngbyaceae cyanobacterium CSU_1_4]|nr:DUF72 domain-containing protein [Leptolyngbyaceae cyanobacterium CSU_1_4]